MLWKFKLSHDSPASILRAKVQVEQALQGLSSCSCPAGPFPCKSPGQLLLGMELWALKALKSKIQGRT